MITHINLLIDNTKQNIMKNLLKPCCDLCSYLLTITGVILFSTSLLILTYCIIHEFSPGSSIRKLSEQHDTICCKSQDSSLNTAIALSIDSLKVNRSKKIYLNQNKAIIIQKVK